MSTVIKCVKQHSFQLDNDSALKMQNLVRVYGGIKNYLYSRYSGIESLKLIDNHRKLIRDELMKTDVPKEQFHILARYWKLALDNVISNIKSEWSNTKNRVKVLVRANKNLSDSEREYIYTILKSNLYLYDVLTYKVMTSTEREKYIHNLIRRYIRKCKGKITHTNKLNIIDVDANLYSYIVMNGSFRHRESGRLYKKITELKLSGCKSRDFIHIYIKSNNKFKGNLQIIVKDKSVEIHRAIKIRTKNNNFKENIVGIDKGYHTMITCSDGKKYGNKLGEYLTKESDRLKNINANRNRLYALMKQHIKDGEYKKAKNILVNNLGKKKYNKQYNRGKERIKSYINKELNSFIRESRPTEIVKEALKFNSNKSITRDWNRRLSSWIKGYLDERIEYKLKLLNIKTHDINPAYTSQECSKCGKLGIRQGTSFKCNCGNKDDADFNASKVILSRFYRKDISLYTPYKKVKLILQAT